MADLSGKTVGILATHMVEESELVDVRRNLADAGAEVVLISPSPARSSRSTTSSGRSATRIPSTRSYGSPPAPPERALRRPYGSGR
jgi:putative intracellular protease/amidase